MQSYNYTIPLIKRKNSKSPLWKLQWSFISKIESTSPKDALCQVWLKLAQWFWRKRFLNILSMNFRYFFIIFPFKGVWPFIWTNLNPLHPMMLCDMFGWNCPSGSVKEDENVKSLRKRWTRTNFDQKSSLKPSAHVS